MLSLVWRHIQEHGDLLTLVALELNDLSQLLVIYQRSVAGELLLERL